VTLLIASLSALSEMDAKKIVALSTLSQLGIMFLSISLGNAILCLFHVITHALAKANLFLRVGNILHIRQSQQDSR
jgi:NADH:ubiquinone oxidoreductase subunit 5 (subunit L)/multisubunit Na+/H+ antiporter MnhA subunit